MKTEEQKAWWFRFFLLLFVLDPLWSWWSHDSESETPPGVPRRNLALCLQPASKVVSEGEGLGGGVREEGGALWLLQSRNVFILGGQAVEMFCRKIMLIGFFFEDGEHWRGERWRIQNRKWLWIIFTFSCPFSGGALVFFVFLYSWAPFLRHNQTLRVSQSNSVSLTFEASFIVLANACLCSLPGLFFFFLGAFWWEEQTSILSRCLCSLVHSLTINLVIQKASELTQWYKGKVRWRYGTK